MSSRGRERDALETNGLTYLIFCPDFFGHVGKRLNKKVKVTLKIYDFIYWKQIITIHILLIISRSDGSSRRRCSVKKSVLRNFAKFTGKHLCQSFF